MNPCWECIVHVLKSLIKNSKNILVIPLHHLSYMSRVLCCKQHSLLVSKCLHLCQFLYLRMPIHNIWQNNSASQTEHAMTQMLLIKKIVLLQYGDIGKQLCYTFFYTLILISFAKRPKWYCQTMEKKQCFLKQIGWLLGTDK